LEFRAGSLKGKVADVIQGVHLDTAPVGTNEPLALSPPGGARESETCIGAVSRACCPNEDFQNPFE